MISFVLFAGLHFLCVMLKFMVRHLKNGSFKYARAADGHRWRMKYSKVK